MSSAPRELQNSPIQRPLRERVAPQSPIGKFLASVLMIAGYGIIAVPTGIMTLELDRASRGPTARECPGCGSKRNDVDAGFCKYCGTKI